MNQGNTWGPLQDQRFLFENMAASFSVAKIVSSSEKRRKVTFCKTWCLYSFPVLPLHLQKKILPIMIHISSKSSKSGSSTSTAPQKYRWKNQKWQPPLTWNSSTSLISLVNNPSGTVPCIAELCRCPYGSRWHSMLLRTQTVARISWRGLGGGLVVANKEGFWLTKHEYIYIYIIHIKRIYLRMCYPQIDTIIYI